ncbi:hypothetical protein ACROYT_G043529 [Oculina patagonica]
MSSRYFNVWSKHSSSYQSQKKTLTMAKALLTVLLIMLVAGEYIDEIDGLLRAGRDRIERLQRGLDPYERKADEMRGSPIYFRRDRIEEPEK